MPIEKKSAELPKRFKVKRIDDESYKVTTNLKSIEESYKVDNYRKVYYEEWT